MALCSCCTSEPEPAALRSSSVTARSASSSPPAHSGASSSTAPPILTGRAPRGCPSCRALVDVGALAPDPASCPRSACAGPPRSSRPSRRRDAATSASCGVLARAAAAAQMVPSVSGLVQDPEVASTPSFDVTPAAPLARAGVAGAQSLDVRSWPERVGEGAVDADPLEVRRRRSGAAQQRSSPAIAGARWLQRSRSKMPLLLRLCTRCVARMRPKLLAARVLHMYYPASRLARPAP